MSTSAWKAAKILGSTAESAEGSLYGGVESHIWRTPHRASLREEAPRPRSNSYAINRDSRVTAESGQAGAVAGMPYAVMKRRKLARCVA